MVAVRGAVESMAVLVGVRCRGGPGGWRFARGSWSTPPGGAGPEGGTGACARAEPASHRRKRAKLRKHGEDARYRLDRRDAAPVPSALCRSPSCRGEGWLLDRAGGVG